MGVPKSTEQSGLEMKVSNYIGQPVCNGRGHPAYPKKRGMP
jgi:hypothetical protein